jgi:asparagine synthase (glutamine-hydrolysing)
VRRRRDDAGPVGSKRVRERDAVLDRRRTVVDTRQQVAVQVDHGRVKAALRIALMMADRWRNRDKPCFYREMCGICGHTHDPDGAAVAAMNAALVHRGPDDQGLFVDDAANVALGARRLSIIDIEGGHQPLSNEDGTVWAVLNGEIYNHPALQDRLRERGHRLSSRTDTEVLVHLYEDHGTAMVHALEGMFAFAVWDRRKRQLLLARDRFGEKPLFYAENRGQLLFGSELTAVLAAMDRPPEIDAAVLDAFFVFGYVPSPMALVEGVRQLEPGHMLLWDADRGRTKIERYWAPPEATDATTPSRQAASEEVEDLLRRSIRGRLLSDVPLGVLLSGGVDSALIAALASAESNGPIKTFTVGYDVGDVDESAAAREVADHVGSEHHAVVLSSAEVAGRAPDVLARLDQPLADQALVAMHAVAEFAREEVTVAVGGEGADELFGGYPRYRWLARADNVADVVPAGLRSGVARTVQTLAPQHRAKRLAYLISPAPVLERHLDWVTDRRRLIRGEVYGPRLAGHAEAQGALAALRGLLANGSSDGEPSVASQLMLLDQRHWLPDDVLAKADRASMLVSLEVRTPYLHHEIAERVAAIPASLHLSRGGKALLREILARHLPRRVASRSKTAFRVPAADWLRGPLRPALEAQIADGAAFEEEWFARGRLQTLADQHAAGADHSSVLWPIMCFGFWLDRLRSDARA